MHCNYVKKCTTVKCSDQAEEFERSFSLLPYKDCVAGVCVGETLHSKDSPTYIFYTPYKVSNCSGQCDVATLTLQSPEYPTQLSLAVVVVAVVVVGHKHTLSCTLLPGTCISNVSTLQVKLAALSLQRDCFQDILREITSDT